MLSNRYRDAQDDISTTVTDAARGVRRLIQVEALKGSTICCLGLFLVTAREAENEMKV